MNDTTQNTNEYTEVAKQLGHAMGVLIKESKGDPAKSYIEELPNGGYNVVIDKGPTFWFKDQMELGSWVLEMNS